MSDRYFDRDRFMRLAGPIVKRDVLLPVYFGLVGYLVLARHYVELFGVDAAIYFRAAVAFRQGLSPWDAVVVSPGGDQYHFAALPPTVLGLVPFTILNERAFVWLWLVLSVLAAFWIVRRLGLPTYWLLFPPLIEGVYAANPQIVLLALLLTSSPILASFAPVLKIYALAPLIGERRYLALASFVALLAASIVAAPALWGQYIREASRISLRLMDEASGGYSAFGGGPSVLLLLATVGLGLLACVDLKAAGWLAAPAIVPASQFHLSTMAMPVLAKSAPLWLIILMAFPVRGLPSAAIAVWGAWSAYAHVRAKRRAVGNG